MNACLHFVFPHLQLLRVVAPGAALPLLPPARTVNVLCTEPVSSGYKSNIRFDFACSGSLSLSDSNFFSGRV